MLGLAIAIFAASVGTADESLLEQVRDMPENLRNQAYAISIGLNAGHDCEEVTHSFVRGADADGTIHVTVRCSNSGDWVILVSPGKRDVFLTCEQAKTIMRNVGIANRSCWTPIDVIDRKKAGQ